MENRQYLVLESPVPKASLELGSLVTDYRRPTRDLFFDDRLKVSQKSWARTDRNVEELMTFGPSQTEKSLLRRMLSTSPTNDLSETYEVQSLECRVYELLSTSAFFEEILSLPGARLWARNILKSHREVYLLTGCRTFREGILRKRQNVKHTASAGVSAGLQVPGLIEVSGVSLEWSRSKSQEYHTQYQTHEEVIFAVSYRTIKLNLFGQKRNALLERGRDWLRPWTKFRAKSTGYGEDSVSSHPSIAKSGQPNEYDRSDAASGMRKLPSDEGGQVPVGTNSSGSLTSLEPWRRSSSSSPQRTQNNLIARQDELHSQDSDLAAVILTDDVQPPSTDVKSATTTARPKRLQVTRACESCRINRIRCDDNQPCKNCKARGVKCSNTGKSGPRSLPTAIHEMVIETDESEEVLLLEGVELSHDDDARAEFAIEDDAWRDTSDKSRVLTQKRLSAVEGLFKFFIRRSQLRPLYAKAVQVASKDAFETALDHQLQEFANILHATAFTVPEKSRARLFQSRAPLVAALITEYIYSLHARDLTLSTTSEEDWVNLNRYLEVKHKWLHPFGDVEEEWRHFDDVGSSPSGERMLALHLQSFLVGRWPFETLNALSRDSIVDGDSVRKISWTQNLIDKYGQFDLRLGLVLTLGFSPYILFLLRSFPMITVFVLAASLCTSFISIKSPIISSSYSRASFSDVCQNAERHLSIPALFLITLFVSYLKRLSRPKVKPGYRRIEWTCECGESLYGDFDNSDPESVDVLEERLHLTRPLSNELIVAPSGSTPIALPQAHANPSGALSRDRTVGSRALTGDIPALFATPSPNTSPVRPARKKYFELCINYGKWERRLGEIDISAISTDGELFRAIRSKYEGIRGFRTKKLYLLEPVDIHFVQFSLEERYRLNIHEKPDSWPSPEELKRKTWEYSHPPKIPVATFLHYMRSKYPYSSAIWLPTMPKKLERRMVEEESQLPMGWGIHVIEGLNKSLVSWLFWMVTTALFVAGTAWSIWKQKGVAVAPLAVGLLGIFVSFLTSEFYKQSEI